MNKVPSWVWAIVATVIVAVLLAWFFWPKPLSSDYLIQKAINDRVVKEAYDRMYERRTEHNATNAELALVRAQRDSIHQRLDSIIIKLNIIKIKHGQQVRFKDAAADDLLRFLGTSPDGLYARSTGFDRQPAPVR